MNGIAMTLARFRAAWPLGLWGLATWSVLRLHDAPIAGEHSICGPWGCGPTIPALLAAHGFWLLVLIPPAVLAGRRLCRARATALGCAGLALSALGFAAVGVAERADRPKGVHDYPLERFAFALATLVDVPIVPVGLAGLVLLGLGRSRRPPASPAPATPATPAEGGCDDGPCDPAGPRGPILPTGRIEVGRPLPELVLRTHAGESLRVPVDLAGRASILYFMRAAGCSICRGHVRAIAGLRDRLGEAGPEVVVVHPGGDAASMGLAGAFPGPLAFASGRGSRAHSALGLAGRGFGTFPGCGTILVDARGVVRYARLGLLPFGAFSGPELGEAARHLIAESPPLETIQPTTGLDASR